MEGADGPGSGYVIAPRLMLTSAHVVPELGAAASLFRPGQAPRWRGTVVWRGTPGGRDDAALVRIDDPAWAPPPGGPARWGRLITHRPGTPCDAWGVPDLVQRPGRAVDTLHPSGTLNPGDRYVGNRYVMNLSQHPPVPAAEGNSPWGGMSGAALFCGDLLAGVIVSDPAGRAHASLEAVPAYVLMHDPTFRAALAENGPGFSTLLEGVEFQRLVAALPYPTMSSAAALLDPRRAVVRFNDGGGTLDHLLSWAELSGRGTYVVGGPVGQGKTRLAHHLTELLTGRGWTTVWLRPAVLAAEALDVLADAVVPLLVVIDKADSRTLQVNAVLDALAAHSGPESVKLLLLAGTSTDWWEALRTSSTSREFLDCAIVTELPTLAPHLVAREEGYRQAVESFVRHLPKVKRWEAYDWPTLAAGLPRRRLDKPFLANARTLHTTALADLLEATGAASREEIRSLLSGAVPLPHNREAWLRYRETPRGAADAHPYPGIMSKTMLPPLAAVYLRQKAVLLSSQGLAEAVCQLSPAEDVLEQLEHCFVVAPAGGGKTSLLRSVHASSMERWRSGQQDTTVPVLVHAPDLVGRSLPAAIAKSVLDEWGKEFPVEFFKKQPLHGVPWIVLVDGLDEITSKQQRGKVLRELAHWRERGPNKIHRFVVATRPMRKEELDLLGPRLPRCTLQPFTADDLRILTQRWFEALRMPQPDDSTGPFTVSRACSQLADVPQNPLMASVLCQLHAASHGWNLPVGRGMIYGHFVVLLRKHRRIHDVAALDSQIRAALGGCDPEVLAHARETLERLPDLITRLAAEWYTTGSVPTDFLLSQPEAVRPQSVPRDMWTSFLEEAVRRSGLMTWRGPRGFGFSHRALLEHLAACHLAVDEPACAQTLGSLLTVEKKWGKRSQEAITHWEPPKEDQLSYVGFLLEAATSQASLNAREITRKLDLLSRGTWVGLPLQPCIAGCRFVLELLRMGTLLPDTVSTSLEEGLEGVASHAPYLEDRLWAVEEGARLKGEDLAEVYCHRARQTSLAGPNRVEAVAQLAKLGDDRAGELLNDIADSGDAPVEAATELAKLGHKKQAADLLNDVARDHTFASFYRFRAAAELAKLGDERALEPLSNLANDASLNTATRWLAARELKNLGHNQAALGLWNEGSRYFWLDVAYRGLRWLKSD
ncbi:hypothetical protein [Streptomyces asiaticus]